ncbi:neutral zinc metallopeptidase [Amaricoccus sp.]|uniref:KPN_02809 family neutral zinc metallopeptidase n=1 Tax=Amaricoccus sp. TaxID=1872485 RepID=UPI00261E1756|nr:neutral zinc metallopeptidase [Amaricoccus sp.]HRO12836.1 neutral zinc metallopeptidase [Amaricoccus sp.]
MRWQGRRESSNIEDRRGRGMGRSAGVGGIGMIIVLLVGIFFGVDLSPLLGPGGVVTTDSAPSGPNAIDDEQERFVAVVLAQTEDVWTPLFSQAGLQYTQPKLVLFTGQTGSACGFAQSAMGPFYCPNDQTVYLDMDFFRVMESQLGSRGDFAKAYVIAHEVGHHVQDEQGILQQVNAARSRASERDSNALSVRVELQADCYAGVWARSVTGTLELTDADIRSALDTAARIGDDALQRASQGRVVPDSFTHGTSQQRQEWFYRGFRTGDDEQCDTFSGRI